MIALMKDINESHLNPKKSLSFAQKAKRGLINTLKFIRRLIVLRIVRAFCDIVTLNVLMWLVMAVEIKIYYDTYKWIIGHF